MAGLSFFFFGISYELRTMFFGLTIPAIKIKDIDKSDETQSLASNASGSTLASNAKNFSEIPELKDAKGMFEKVYNKYRLEAISNKYFSLINNTLC